MRTTKAPAEHQNIQRWAGGMVGWLMKPVSAESAEWSVYLLRVLIQQLGHLRVLPPSTPPVNDAGVSKSQILCFLPPTTPQENHPLTYWYAYLVFCISTPQIILHSVTVISSLPYLWDQCRSQHYHLAVTIARPITL